MSGKDVGAIDRYATDGTECVICSEEVGGRVSDHYREEHTVIPPSLFKTSDEVDINV